MVADVECNFTSETLLILCNEQLDRYFECDKTNYIYIDRKLSVAIFIDREILIMYIIVSKKKHGWLTHFNQTWLFANHLNNDSFKS